MALTKITGKDFKEAVDWLLKEKQGCVHQVLGRTDEGTELCLVIGWADLGYDLEEVKKNGYEDEGYYICSKIGYQHRNNGMQSDFEWDFPMPYNPETGDVWDTDTYVAKGDEQSWQTDADMYNKEAEEIWATWGVPNEDGQTTLDIMESKKCSRKCGSKKSEADIDKSKREFDIAFKTGKNTVFEIDYYRCGSNDEPYFSTAATIYYPNHRGMSRGGQCQDDALKDNKVFYDFYKKWNPKHLHKLTDAELDELETDIEALKKAGYPYVEAEDGDWENRVSRRSSELIRQKLPRSLQDSPIAQKIEAMMLPKSSMQKKKESLAKKTEGLDNLVGIKDVKEIQKQIDSLGLTFVESGDYAGHIWGYAVYKSPKGEYLQYDYNGTNDACRSVKVYKSKQDFIDAEGYDPEKSESKKSEAKKHTCSMQKKKESLTAKKSEAASDTIRVTDEDVMLTVNEVDVDEHGGSFSVDTPEKGKSYDLREMKDMVKGMCEDCSGYSDISRDGSDVRIAVKAPESDKGGEFNGDYYDAFVMRCTARIVHVSLEGVVDYLAED